MDLEQKIDKDRAEARALLASVRRTTELRARDVAVVAALDQAQTALAEAVAALGAASRAASRLAPCCVGPALCASGARCAVHG